MNLATSIHEVSNSDLAPILQTNNPILVDFQASWCGPCRQMSPLLEEMAEAHSDVRFATVDVDQNQDLALQYQITAIPTLMVFKNGKVVERLSGAMPRRALKALVERNL